MKRQTETPPISQLPIDGGLKITSVASPSIPPQVPMDMLRASNPGRPVDWRWRRADRLHKDVGNQTEAGDAIVTRVLGYLRVTRGNPSGYASPWPALRDALAIKKAATQHNLALRVELEAYILAGDSDVALSNRFDLNVEVVQVFQSVLFDVRGRINNRRVILSSFLTPADLPLKENNWRVFTRLLGFYGRPDILDDYPEYRRHPRPSPPRTYAGLTEYDLELYRSRLHVRYWILKALLDVSGGIARPLSVDAKRSTIATIKGLELGIRLIGTELLVRQEVAIFREKRIRYAARTCC